MKKIFWIFLVFLTLSAAGIALFLATLRVERFKPFITTQLEQVLKKPVSIGRLSVAWQGGLGLALEDVAVGKTYFTAERISLFVKIFTVFTKNIEFETLQVENGVFAGFHDIDLTVGHVVLGKSAELSGRAAYRSDNQNIRFKSRWVADGTQGGVLEDFGLEMRLEGLKLEKKDIGNLAGKITVSSDQLFPLNGKTSLFTVTLADGRAAVGESYGVLADVSLAFEGSVRLSAPRESLEGQGQLDIKNLIISNKNLMREILTKLSVVPGVKEALQTMPQDYAQRLYLRDTVFWPIQAPFRVRQSAIYFDQLQAGTPDFLVYGRAAINFEGAVNIPLVLRIGPGFSSLLTSRVGAMRFLANPQGYIEIPAVIRGAIGKLKIKVDTEYIISRVVAVTGQELLSDLLTKGGGNDAGKNLLKNLF